MTLHPCIYCLHLDSYLHYVHPVLSQILILHVCGSLVIWVWGTTKQKKGKKCYCWY